MKKNIYLRPIAEVVSVEIEKGFATSGGEAFGINQFKYDTSGNDVNNTAW